MNKSCEKLEAYEKVVVLFTSNFQGGMLQFTIQLSLVLRAYGYKVVVFMPVNANTTEVNDKLIVIKKYKRYKSITFRNKLSKKIADEIKIFKPSLVLFCDTSIISTQVLLSLNKCFLTSIYIHDIVPHPAKFDMYEYIKEFIRKRILRQALKVVDQIILLSENSYKMFRDLHPTYIKKADWMPLGVHVPEVEPKKPSELEKVINDRYYLFFGRISKYKGIMNLLEAYDAIKRKEKPLLVIAGSGKIGSKEKEIIQKNNNIILINRYIEDCEMIYLIRNSLTVVLPYIEASQSGVIPIAYYFSVPVITSNVPGLVEFVQKGVSGIVCSNNEEMKDALLEICDDSFRKHLSKGAYRFYTEQLDWSKNVKQCIIKILEK